MKELLFKERQGLIKLTIWPFTGPILLEEWICLFLTFSLEGSLRLHKGGMSPPTGTVYGLSDMLVMLGRHGAGFLDVTGLLGVRGLVMLSGQRYLRLTVSGLSLLRSKISIKF